MKSPAENTLTPETFRLVATTLPPIGRGTPAEMPRQHARLLIGRLDQAVADAAMLGAFAEREDIGRAGLQLVVDDDAAVDRDAGVLGQRDIRPDAGGEDHRIGLDAACRPSVRRLRRGARRGCARCWH